MPILIILIVLFLIGQSKSSNEYIVGLSVGVSGSTSDGFNYNSNINEKYINETKTYNNHLKSGKIINEINDRVLSPFEEGVYKVRPAFIDTTLGGKGISGSAFESNLIGSWELGGYDNWVFYKDRGELNILSNGDLIITGPIVPTRDQSSCHSWFVNMMFTPSINNTNNIPYKQLNYKSYKPHGPIDTRNWKYYIPKIDSLSNSWIGIGCTHIIKIDLSIQPMFTNRPLQLGIGANGRNGNNGIEFSIPLIFNNDKRKYINFNVDIVLTNY